MTHKYSKDTLCDNTKQTHQNKTTHPYLAMLLHVSNNPMKILSFLDTYGYFADAIFIIQSSPDYPFSHTLDEILTLIHFL